MSEVATAGDVEPGVRSSIRAKGIARPFSSAMRPDTVTSAWAAAVRDSKNAAKYEKEAIEGRMQSSRRRLSILQTNPGCPATLLYTRRSMKIETLLTEAEISEEFAESMEAR